MLAGMAPRIRTDTILGRTIVDQGWTVSELAITSGVHHRTLSNYLGGLPIIDAHLVKLADALGVEPEDLVE